MNRLDYEFLARPANTSDGRKLSVGLARDSDEIRAAQRLRWRIFGEEMGARLHSPVAGLDQDVFDAYCNHLVVRDGDGVVGTYRILSPEGAGRIGSYYAESEFNLARLAHIKPQLAELGRSCIEPRYRTGGVIALLWSGIARYVLARGYQYLAGCASMSVADGGGGARLLYAKLPSSNIAPEEYRVFPRTSLPAWRGDAASVTPPPLLKGYLRLGAYVCGEPAWDPEFDTADFFMLLPIERMTARYARHFIGRDR